MKAKKFYAVKVGKKPGVYIDWETAQKEVLNYPGAIYKSFPTFEEAWEFLTSSPDNRSEAPNDFNQLEENLPPRSNRPDEAVAYTDGSYDEETDSFSYGVVIFWRNKMIQISRRFFDHNDSNLRNVAGELEGAKRAIQFAVSNKIKHLTLYHDYHGIASWANEEWQANNDFTKDYQSFAKTAMQQVDINFQWVKGHSGNRYNEMVDQLAKTATREEYRHVEDLEEEKQNERI